MTDIILSSGVRGNLLSLQNTAKLLERTQERLATGLKVNSALDDPTAFFTSASLNNRAADLSRLLDSISLGVQTLEAADVGIKAITDLLETAQASARQALQAPGPLTPNTAATVTGTGASVAADVAATFTGSVTSIAADAAAVATGTVTTIAADVAATSASSTGGNIDGTELLSSAELGTFANGDTLTIASSDSSFTSVSIAFDGGTATTGATLGVGSATLANLVTEINSQAGSSIASIVSGELSITSPTGDVTVGGTNAAAGLSLTSSVVTNATFGAGGIAGESLTFTTAAGISTVTFGASDDTRAEVLATLNGGASGLTFSFSGNSLVATAPNTAAGAITTTGGTNALAAVGFTASQVNDVTNTTLDAITAGETLTFTTAAGSSTVTFGTGSGQANTQTELLSALNGGASGATFAITGNALVATAANVAAGDITVASSSGASALTGLGFTSGQVANVTNATLGTITQGDTLTINIGGTTQTVTFGNGSGEVDTLAELNTSLAAIQTSFGGTTAVSVDASGNLTVTAGNNTDTVTLGGTATLTTFGTNLTTTAITPSTGPAPVDNVIRAKAESDYNELLTQITELSRDASFNGNNLLQSDNLTIFFNENSTSSLTINGVDFDSTGLGLSALASGAFQTNSNINTALAGLETAILQIRTQAGTFGSNLSVVETRQQFTSSLIKTLETGGADLVLADINEEGANLLALQTRQQLSSTALSLASQADQNVLRLFG